MTQIPLEAFQQNITQEITEQLGVLEEQLSKESKIYKVAVDSLKIQQDKLKKLEEQLKSEEELSKNKGVDNDKAKQFLKDEILKKKKGIEYSEKLRDKTKETLLNENDKIKAITLVLPCCSPYGAGVSAPSKT